MKPMERIWRYVETWEGDPAFHMALDEAMMMLLGERRIPPTLRFYTWRPSALSLGMHQDAATSVDLHAVRALGVGLVRRPSGGRTVFHDRELTYSVVVREDDARMPKGLMAAFRRLTEGLKRGYHRLGIFDATLNSASDAPESKENTPVCFDTPGAYELVIGGKKAAGSAQTRRGGVLLQHGSLPLSYDVETMFRLFYFPSSEARARAIARFHATATSIEAALGRPVTLEEVRDAMLFGFGQALGVEFVPGSLTAEEQALAQRLAAEKYTNPEWTFKKSDPLRA